MKAMVKGFLATSMAAAGLLLLPLSAAPSHAQTSTYSTDYKVTMLGLPIASVRFTTRIDGTNYRISGKLRTSFLAEVIEPTRGTVLSDGKINGGRFQADEFDIRYTSGKKRYRAAMTLSRGNVRSSIIEPTKKIPSDWVPVTNAHKRSVVDPLAGLVFPGKTRPCPQTVAVFDGESRFDLKLVPIGVRPYSTVGFSGDTTVCGLKFTPKGGYRKSNTQIDYVRKLKGMEIWFARHPEGGFTAPIYAKIPTKLGTMIVAATRFGG